MRRLSPPIILAVVAVVAVSVPAPAADAPARPRPSHHHGQRCPVRPRRLVVRNHQAEIYLGPDRYVPGLSYRGCVYRVGRDKFIGYRHSVLGEDAGDTRNIRLVETLVAREASAVTRNGAYFRVVVTNLVRRGGRSFPTGSPSRAQEAFDAPVGQVNGLDGVGHTTSLVLKADGAVAWIVNDNAPPDPPTYEVIKADATGRPIVLAAGTDITPGSLTLSGSTLHWAQAASTHTATLN